MAADSLHDWSQKNCKACEGGVPPLTETEIAKYLKDVWGWKLEANRIDREFVFTNFVEALQFLNRVGAIAESEGHHPDMFLHQYNKVRISLWTHAVGGLTENDFIVAAKINALF